MAISELQLGLIGAGVVAVVGVLAYNKWQERKAQKHAEKAFRSEHRDVLFEPSLSADTPLDIPDDVSPPEPAAHPAPQAVPRSAPPAEVGRKAPDVPADVDERVDCVLRIESIEPLVAGRVWLAQQTELAGLSKPVGWFAFDEGSNKWISLERDSGEAHHWFCAAMQMVDRRGPINDADFTRFTDGVQRLADQFMAIPASPLARAEALGRAEELDRFCASVDVQIGVNLVSRGAPFAGTKLRGLVEAQGMRLRGDGLFHAEDDDGNSQFVLGNLEPTLMSAEGMRDLQTRGLTLIVDVPRVAEGAQVFDRMMLVARQLADTLDADLVDDNRSPFGPEAAKVIRGQIQQFQAQMREYGLPAGSALAMRLFAA
ncbi:cell division protein ZipA C-terminal FtsZ-binding domain-containing protein [Denitromonas sp.]|uniref:cell division protein ZipA C-terminal FtsZ-binding domain-containing protein n=1 Tax=Denitromonas sp. TaxID=2734609 RepID=UPI003A8B0F49